MRAFFTTALAAATLALTVGPAALAQSYNTSALQFSLLPSARSVQTGDVATVFGTVLSTIDQTGCELVLGGATPGVTLAWRLLDENNQLTGDGENANFAINGTNGRRQNLLVAMSSATAINTSEIEVFVRCPNDVANPSFDFYRNPIYPGVNTLALTVSSAPAPDIIVIGQSLTSDGYVRLPSPGARRPAAISAVNIGATATVEVSANTGPYNLPVTLQVCETNASGVCTSPRAESLSVNFATNEVRTFNVYVQSTGERGVPDMPAIARTYFNFGQPAAAGDEGPGAASVGPQYTTRYGTTSFAILASGPETNGSEIGGVYRGLINGGGGGPAGAVPAMIVIPNPNNSTIAISQTDAYGWAATSQGAILPINAQTGSRAFGHTSLAYANGLSPRRQATNSLNRNDGNIFPRAGIRGAVTNFFNSPISFSYQAIYDPIAEQVISGNLTSDGAAIIGQTFDVFYQGVDIGDASTGSETGGGGAVGSGSITFPGQTQACDVAVVNLRQSTELTTWVFSFNRGPECTVPTYEGYGYVDDTRGPRRIELLVYPRTIEDGAIDTFPLTLVARQ